MEAYHNNCMAMNTLFDLIMVECEGESADRVFTNLQQELFRLENKLNYYSKQSLLTKINEEAYKNPVKLDDEMYEILNSCIDFNSKTEGVFDITAQSYLNFVKQNDKLKIEQYSPGMDNISLDSEQKTISFVNEWVKIDLGGYGKGYAMQKLIDILNEHLIANAFLCFGGSSVTGHGHHPHGEYWPSGVQNVFDQTESLYQFKLKDLSLSTSGWSVQKNPHIINPQSAEIIEKYQTVSVVSKSPLIAEILSTALFASSDDQCEIILSNFPECKALKITYEENKTKEIVELSKAKVVDIVS